jgi:drug/metabolite transporter (DMT)-like permease
MGYLLALFAVLLWSFNTIISIYFSTSLAPLELAFGRWLTASVVLVCLSGRSLWQNRTWFLQHCGYLVLLAITGIVIVNTLIYYAGHTASAVNMSLLNTLGPIFLLLLSHVLFRMSINKVQIGGIGLALLGVITIIINGDFLALSQIHWVSGDFIMLGNAFCFAVYSLLQQKRPDFIPQTTLLAASAIIGTVILGCLMLIFVPEQRFLTLQPLDVATFVYLGIFNSVCGYLAWNTALNKIGVLKTAVIYYTLPIFAAIEAYLVLGSDVRLPQIFGGALVISGIALANFGARKRA